jgi:hypothetical protein
VPHLSFKTVDDKGRLTLGREFAGRAVQVIEDDDALRLRFVEVVPAREAWLWKNEVALASVRRGLEEAARGQLSDGPPDFPGALAFADEIPDDGE